MRFFHEHELLDRYRTLFRERLGWKEWEYLIRRNGLTIDRPRGAAHPDYAHIVYPIDYGYVNDTLSTDGEAVDVFVGSAETGLVGALLTLAHNQQKREVKLLYNCSPEEVYLVNGFLNFDRTLLEAILALRWEMAALRTRAEEQAKDG